jgi:hypothetical protein
MREARTQLVRVENELRRALESGIRATIERLDASLEAGAADVVETEGERAWRHSWMQEREANAKLVALLREARDSLSHGCWNGSCCVVRGRIDALLSETDSGDKS